CTSSSLRAMRRPKAEPVCPKFSCSQVGESGIAAVPGAWGRQSSGTAFTPSGATMSARPRPPPHAMTWTLQRALPAYSIPHWSDGYFDLDDAGRMVVLPHGAGGPALPLPRIVDQATAAGLKLPLLLRFSDILGDRLGKLQAAFARAMTELDYRGGYTAVYP